MAKKNFYVHLDMNKNQILNLVIEQQSSAPLSPAEGQVYYNTVLKEYFGFDGTSWISLSQVIDGALVIQGEITNANTNPSFPGTPSAGDVWFITTNAGTVGGIAVEIGDQLIYASTGWFIMQKNVVSATESVQGVVRIATQAETNAGTEDTAAITSLKLTTFMVAKSYVKQVVSVITSLVANTPQTVTHGLGLANANNIIVQCYQAGEQIVVRVAPSTINAVVIEANTTLANVTVTMHGI